MITLKKLILLIAVVVAVTGALTYSWGRWHGRAPAPGPREVPSDHVSSAAPANAEGPPRAAIQLDTRRRQLLGVRLARVERGAIERPVRAVGIIRYDETRLADVNLKLDGWIRKLYVNATGQPVRRGQPLFEIYSPELLATENEYLLALATRDRIQQSQVAEARTQTDRLVESARRRLQLWDLPPDEVQTVERTRQASATVTFRSPVSGFVIEKAVIEGMHVEAGRTLYKVADLSTVWVEADVHESDASFMKVGVPAVVTLDAQPGISRRGRAVYIYPFVDEKTRTLKVRFAFPNPALQLKPGMYANVDIAPVVGSGLTIPVDALIDAGREQLVFVAEGNGYYQPRNVQIGQRLADRVQVTAGLQEGEQVATGAAFFLDSESQLRAVASNWGASADERPNQQASDALKITVLTEPDPPGKGDAIFEARIMDPSGNPVTGAQVNVRLYMAAMPSMSMPAMTSDAKLADMGAGTYRASVNIPTTGRWDVTVTVLRNGQRIGSKQATVVAQ